MLVCALIEARSHERFVLLSEALGGEGLGACTATCADAEARTGRSISSSRPSGGRW